MSTKGGNVSDLTELTNLNDKEIILNLKERFYKEQIYTYIGDVLIAVNPYKTIPNYYNAEQIKYYQTQARYPPHIYWTAEKSYIRLKEDRTNQCIVVTGDSGAGKTESTRRILQHLTRRSPCEITLIDKLENVNPLIELFGNASTQLNNNSSRFGKLIELSYNKDGSLIGGVLKTFVLEQSRVVQHKAQEKNFHIFYAFFSGIPEHDLQGKYSLKSPTYSIMDGDQDFQTSMFGSEAEKQHYGKHFSEGCEILTEIKFTEKEKSQILDTLAACLHLGNIKFEKIGDDTDGVTIVDDEDGHISLRRAIPLLGIDNTEVNIVAIKDAFISLPIAAQGHITSKLLNPIQAADVRDSIVKALYSGVFTAIIDQINKSIKGSIDPNERQPFIGILDISGFENVTENSLEQLFINITNERLHQYLQHQIFGLENLDYDNEDIQMQTNTFHDNQPVLDLICEKPGILSIMDDQANISNSDVLVAEYNNKLLSKKDVYKPGHTMSFAIFHYAGWVKYSASKFLEKNRGTVPEKIKDIFSDSNNFIVHDYFDSHDSFSNNRSSKEINKCEDRRQPKSKKSAAFQYKKSLDCLVEILADASPLFVRCIKSNDKQQAGYFDENLVLKQLESAGIYDVIRIRREGFPTRMSYVKFLERFKIFRNFMAEGENQDEIIDNIVQACNVDKASYKIGKTKVFMKENVLETIQKKTTELEKQREKQRINLEREEKQARLRGNGQSSRQQDSLGTRNPQNSTKIQKITDDIEITTVQNKTPVNSSSQTSFYVENQMRKNEKKKRNEYHDLLSRIWDVFRNTERDFGDCEKVEKYFLKLCRFFICVGLLFGIAMKGAATILIPLLLSSQLNTEKGDAQQSNALTELILCYSTPIALTFIQSLCKVCFGKVKNVEWKFFLPVLILEGAEVCGTSYLLFNVFCNHSMTSGITFIMTSFTIPSILNILKQIALAREIKPREKNLSKKHSNKFVIRLSRVIIALIAMVIQCGVLVCMIVQPHIIFSDTVSNQIEYTTQEKILIVASLVGVSMGFCQNFLYSNLKFGSFDLKEWRTEVDKARPKINLKLCIVKVGIYLLMAKCLLPEISWTFTEEHANLNDNFIDKIFKIFREHKLMFIYIYCSIFASYEGVLACKLHMQRISFFIPLTLVPLVCFGGVIGYCYKWSEDTNLFGVAVSCPSVDINSVSMWAGPNAALWVSIIFLTWYGLFPDCNSLEQDQRLFILPTRDSFFSSLGLLMKRKDDAVEIQLDKHDTSEKKNDKGKEEENESGKKEENQSGKEEENQSGKKEPYIYICGTMWHETRQEMLQLLKSLFRLDLSWSKNKRLGKEIHIIFDDAFETDKESQQRIPNEYVKQLVECMEEASNFRSVVSNNLPWDSKPTKKTTPYGGRLEWNMPMQTDMTIHLKDKNKIRHKKRWSQVMYMYYLLGYKMMGANGKYPELEIDETIEKNHKNGKRSILNLLPKDKKKKAYDSFILALDGDVDFKHKAVEKLIDKMKINDKVGAVCGRIHPIGSGPVVWYQQFEYAIGHWLQKATEHVFGCVLCCPGAFSLFRAAAVLDDNVLRMYTSPPLEARHFIQYEQGEDRWLCTLMLQQGWKIDYAASADAFTFAPEKFEDFFVQRRRWAPSTLANIIDLLSSWRVTTKVNPNISTLFVFYQFILFASSLLGLGMVTLMITGSFNAVLKITLFQSYVVAVIPVALYAIICMKCSNDKQIAAAALLSTVYTLVMVIVTVGLFVNLAAEKTFNPNVIFFIEILFIFLFAGLAHPKELMCLVHGLLYYVMVPSTFIFLTVYYMCNIHVVSWGTREKKTEDDNIKNTEAIKSTKTTKLPILNRCLQTLGVLTFVNETKRKIKQYLGARAEQQINDNEPETQKVRPDPHTESKRRKVTQDLDAWQKMEYLGLKEKKGEIKDSETEFWLDILDKYLHPFVEDPQKKKEIEIELKSLRNNVAFGFLLINFLFSTAVFQLQNNTDQLKNVYILNEYEPLSIAFLLVFALVILLQFIGMLIHRWGTFLHLIASVHLWPSSKAQENESAVNDNKKTITENTKVVSSCNSTQRYNTRTVNTQNQSLHHRKVGKRNHAYTENEV